MYQKKEYKTLRFIGQITSCFGWLFVVGAIIGGFTLGDMPKGPGVIVGALIGFLSGVLMGLPFIVMGQSASVFLDQKELLEDILEITKENTSKIPGKENKEN